MGFIDRSIPPLLDYFPSPDNYTPQLSPIFISIVAYLNKTENISNPLVVAKRPISVEDLNLYIFKSLYLKIYAPPWTLSRACFFL